MEVPEVACRGLQDLFEYPAYFPELEGSILRLPFVEDFPKLGDFEPQEIDFTKLTEEEYEEILEPYVGPTFEPEELVAWATAWGDIIRGMNEEERRAVLPLATQSYDWTPALLDDLKQIAEQGTCAQKHGVKIHIEMY